MLDSNSGAARGDARLEGGQLCLFLSALNNLELICLACAALLREKAKQKVRKSSRFL